MTTDTLVSAPAASTRRKPVLAFIQSLRTKHLERRRQHLIDRSIHELSDHMRRDMGLPPRGRRIPQRDFYRRF